ncbi:hypothetical protein P280DRAFT_546451 [Massarina eburnea CBS 473.64]|uniref:Uncharacterized protein n=1 Tax=Massarina eburnea CBS 473.64 TaxID=1395130 RepID=A0A6A6SB32_9PLEO|nr:hypothetical protein P280DRAFT_546451 [Massarina eburnea CBS 473.64]
MSGPANMKARVREAAMQSTNPAFVASLSDNDLGGLMTTMWMSDLSRQQQNTIVQHGLSIVLARMEQERNTMTGRADQVHPPHADRPRESVGVSTPTKRGGNYGMFDDVPSVKRPKVIEPVDPLSDDDDHDDDFPIPPSHYKPSRRSYHDRPYHENDNDLSGPGKNTNNQATPRIKKEPGTESPSPIPYSNSGTPTQDFDTVADTPSDHEHGSEPNDTHKPTRRKSKAPTTTGDRRKPGGTTVLATPIHDPLPNLEKLLWIPSAKKTTKGGELRALAELPPDVRIDLMSHFSSTYLTPARTKSYKSWHTKVLKNASGQERLRCINNVAYIYSSYFPKYSHEPGTMDRACDSCVNTKRVCAKMVRVRGVDVLAVYPLPGPLRRGVGWGELRFWVVL